MVLAWVRWGARFTVTPPQLKGSGRAPGGAWQPRDWHGQWIKIGYRVQIAGHARTGTVRSVDGPGKVTVEWDDHHTSSIASDRLRVVSAKPPAGRSAASRPPSPPQPVSSQSSGGWPPINDFTPRPGMGASELSSLETTARGVLAELLPGREFAGYTLGDLSAVKAMLEPEGMFERVLYAPYSLTWSVEILKDGTWVGDTTRLFGRDPDTGLLWVEHKVLSFKDSDHQGNGFAPAWNGWLEQWYRASGVTEIRVSAGLDVGGYAWARHGFDFADEDEARKILMRLQREVAEVGKWLAEHEHDDVIPDALYRDRIREVNAALDVLAAADQHRFGQPGFPTAYEISQAGRRDPKQNPKLYPWIGARAMLGSFWKGVKPL